MILLLALAAHAADAPSLTMQDALRLVVERNPDRSSAALAEQIATIDAHRARLDRFTATVSASGGADAGVSRAWGADVAQGLDTVWDTRADATVPLYAGGALRASIDRADAAAGVAGLERQITERALQRAAYTAYWTIKGYEQQIAASEEGLDLTRQALAIIEAKANAGLAAGVDVNRSRVDLYSQQETLVAEQAALYASEQDLLRLLHLPGDAVHLTDEPPEAAPPRADLPADGSGRPELARQRLQDAEADAAVRLARSAVLPTVALAGTAGVGGSAAGTPSGTLAYDAAGLRPALDASVGLTLRWNPFDLAKTRDAVAVARLAAEQVRAASESERDGIAAELRTAASAVDALSERLPLVDARVALARDNLQIVQQLYAQGSATILDLFNAQASFRQARSQGARLRVDLAIAAYDLRWLSGASLLAPDTAP